MMIHQFIYFLIAFLEQCIADIRCGDMGWWLEGRKQGSKAPQVPGNFHLKISQKPVSCILKQYQNEQKI